MVCYSHYISQKMYQMYKIPLGLSNNGQAEA